MAYTNTAYDFARFSAVEKTVKPEIKVVKTKKNSAKAARGLKIRLFVAVAFVVAVLTVLVYNKMVLFEAVASTTRAENQLIKLQNEQSRMQIELEGIVSLKGADEYASKTLGLVKMDNVRVIHVSLRSENVIEKTDNNGFLYSVLDMGITSPDTPSN